MNYDKNQNYLLMTPEDNYFVEYLLGELVLSKSISEAMIFDSNEQANKFQKMLQELCNLETTISTFITYCI